MSIKELAEDFTQLCRENKGREAAEKYWANDVVSLEAMEGDTAHLVGKEAVFKKHDWWEATFEMHGGDIKGPYLHGDQFTVIFTLDATNKETGKRENMEEVALYTVKDNKITEERFFYND